MLYNLLFTSTFAQTNKLPRREGWHTLTHTAFCLRLLAWCWFCLSKLFLSRFSLNFCSLCLPSPRERHWRRSNGDWKHSDRTQREKKKQTTSPDLTKCWHKCNAMHDWQGSGKSKLRENRHTVLCGGSVSTCRDGGKVMLKNATSPKAISYSFWFSNHAFFFFLHILSCSVFFKPSLLGILQVKWDNCDEPLQTMLHSEALSVK